MNEERAFQENTQQTIVDFPCPDCGQPARVNVDNNGLQHAMPYCRTYQTLVADADDGQTFLKCAFTGERYIGAGNFERSGIAPLVLSPGFGGSLAMRAVTCLECGAEGQVPAAVRSFACKCGHTWQLDPVS